MKHLLIILLLLTFTQFASGDLVSRWGFNTASPVTVTDRVGSDDGTWAIGTASSVSSPYGTAYSFDGAADYIDTNTTFQSTFQDSFSISLWVKPTDGQPAGGSEKLFGTADNISSGSSSNQMTLVFATNGEIEFQIGAAGNKTMGNFDTAFSNGQETWHFLAVSVTSGEKVRFYFDGVSDGTDDISAITLSNYTSIYNLYLGAINQNSTPGGHLAGAIIDVRIYNHALTAGEVSQLFNPVRYGGIGRNHRRGRY